MTPTPVAASLGSQGPYLGQTWDLFASLDGHVVTFCGTVVAKAVGFDEARARYNELRSSAALARESLRHTLEMAR